MDRPNNVIEESPIGSMVMVVTARDGDRDLVSYEIIEQSVPRALRIQPATGEFETLHPYMYHD